MAANKTIQGGFGEANNQNSPLNNFPGMAVSRGAVNATHQSRVMVEDICIIFPDVQNICKHANCML